MRIDLFLDLFFGLAPEIRWLIFVVVLVAMTVVIGFVFYLCERWAVNRQIAELEAHAEWLHNHNIDLPR